MRPVKKAPLFPKRQNGAQMFAQNDREPHGNKTPSA